MKDRSARTRRSKYTRFPEETRNVTSVCTGGKASSSLISVQVDGKWANVSLASVINSEPAYIHYIPILVDLYAKSISDPWRRMSRPVTLKFTLRYPISEEDITRNIAVDESIEISP